jgi:hypothetical protein
LRAAAQDREDDFLMTLGAGGWQLVVAQATVERVARQLAGR